MTLPAKSARLLKVDGNCGRLYNFCWLKTESVRLNLFGEMFRNEIERENSPPLVSSGSVRFRGHH